MKIGMEKEFLMFDNDFKPLNVKAIDLPQNTMLDFSDNQFEIVSDVYDHTENLYCNMYKVLDNGIITSNKMWPLSMPGIIDYKVSIEGCATEEERIYRQGLLAKYSPSMLLFSGIHINVSLEKENYCSKVIKPRPCPPFARTSRQQSSPCWPARRGEQAPRATSRAPS